MLAAINPFYMDCYQTEFFAELCCWLFAAACGTIGAITFINSRPIASENQAKRESRVGLIVWVVVAILAYFALQALKLVIVHLLK